MDVLPQLLISGVLLGGVYALLSIGLTLVFGVLRVINFAHGEFLMLSMYAAYWLYQLMGVAPGFSLIVILPVFFLFAWILAKVLVSHTVGAPAVTQVFLTFGLSLVLQNIALILWKSDVRSILTTYGTATHSLGFAAVSIPRFVCFAVAIILTVGLTLFLRHSRVGRAIRSTAQDREAASLMGIDVSSIYRITFALGGAYAGFAGALMIPFYSVQPLVGLEFILVALVIVVLGGLGSLPGALLGGIIIGTIETLSGYFIDVSLSQAIYFLLFVAVLIIRPAGLFGAKGSEEVGLR